MLNKTTGTQIFSIAGRKNAGYDIPLHLRLGTEFLVLLIALMTYLLLLSASASLSLGHMTHQWVSGLKNAITIEIPSSSSATRDADALVKNLQDTDFVKNIRVVSQEDMGKMLSPWLGNQTAILSDLPLPVLVSVEITVRNDKIMQEITNVTRRVAPNAMVDAHEEWLTDLVKLTNGLRLTAVVIFSLIIIVTALVIAGAVRSRMAIHARELELLHIMGASDNYIAGQFIHYVASQSMKGMAFGIIVASLTLIGFIMLGQQSPDTIPKINLINADWIIFMAVPLIILVVGMITARQTVMRVLNELP